MWVYVDILPWKRRMIFCRISGMRGTKTIYLVYTLKSSKSFKEYAHLRYLRWSDRDFFFFNVASSSWSWINIDDWLVVKQPLWKIWKSIGMIIPNIWENKKCSKPPTRWTYVVKSIRLQFRCYFALERRNFGGSNDPKPGHQLWHGCVTCHVMGKASSITRRLCRTYLFHH